MGIEVSINLGSMGEGVEIPVHWFDENGVQFKDRLTLETVCVDKPRVVEIRLNGILIGRLTGLMVERPCYDVASNRVPNVGKIVPLSREQIVESVEPYLQPIGKGNSRGL